MLWQMLWQPRLVQLLLWPPTDFRCFAERGAVSLFCISHNVYLIKRQDHQSATRGSRLNVDNVFTGECVLHSDQARCNAMQCNIQHLLFTRVQHTTMCTRVCFASGVVRLEARDGTLSRKSSVCTANLPLCSCTVL